MPRLSDSMEEGTIVRWLKDDGAAVSRGDELVEIETDKATMTYEADADGVLAIVAPEGATLPIGEVIARIGEGTAGNGAGPAAASAKPAPPAPPAQPEPAARPEPDPRPEPEPRTATAGRVRASPVARRVARERGVDLAALHGSGPGGRIVKADVEGATAAPPAALPAGAPAGAPATVKGEARVVEPTRAQQVVARRMAEAKATVPEFTLDAEVDMGAAVDARAQMRAVAGEDSAVPSYNDLVVKACALALRDVPKANGAYRDGRYELYERVNVGVAVAGEDSLVVPVVFDADRKPLGVIAGETRALAARVRDGTITPPELSGATFTVSNLGMYGVTRFTAIVNPPQAAILAVGELAERPVVREGEVVPGRTMPVTLVCDHRILFGAEAARFLSRVRARLEHPAALAL